MTMGDWTFEAYPGESEEELAFEHGRPRTSRGGSRPAAARRPRPPRPPASPRPPKRRPFSRPRSLFRPGMGGGIAVDVTANEPPAEPEPACAALRFVQQALGSVLGRTVPFTGKLDAATRRALLDYSQRGAEIFNDNRSMNQVFDQLFRDVASGRGNTAASTSQEVSEAAAPRFIFD